MVFLTTRPRKRVANQASLPDRAAHPSRAPFACSKLQDFAVKQLVILAGIAAHKLSLKVTLRKGGTNGRHYGRLELVCGAAVFRHGYDRNLFGWFAPRQAQRLEVHAKVCGDAIKQSCRYDFLRLRLTRAAAEPSLLLLCGRNGVADAAERFLGPVLTGEHHDRE